MLVATCPQFVDTKMQLGQASSDLALVQRPVKLEWRFGLTFYALKAAVTGLNSPRIENAPLLLGAEAFILVSNEFYIWATSQLDCIYAARTTV